MGLWVWGEEDHRDEVVFSSHRIGVMGWQRGLTLTILTHVTWLRVVFASFVDCKVTNFFFSLPEFLEVSH